MACSSEHPCQRGTQKAGEKDPSLLPPSHGGLPAPPTLVKDSGLLTPLGCLLGLERLHCHLCCVTTATQRKKSRWAGKSSKENVGSSVIRVPRRHFRCPDLGKTEPPSLVSLRMPRCLRVPLTSGPPLFSTSLSPCFLQQGLTAALLQPHPQHLHPLLRPHAIHHPFLSPPTTAYRGGI